LLAAHARFAEHGAHAVDREEDVVDVVAVIGPVASALRETEPVSGAVVIGVAVPAGAAGDRRCRIDRHLAARDPAHVPLAVLPSDARDHRVDVVEDRAIVHDAAAPVPAALSVRAAEGFGFGTVGGCFALEDGVRSARAVHLATAGVALQSPHARGDRVGVVGLVQAIVDDGASSLGFAESVRGAVLGVPTGIAVVVRRALPAAPGDPDFLRRRLDGAVHDAASRLARDGPDAHRQGVGEVVRVVAVGDLVAAADIEANFLVGAVHFVGTGVGSSAADLLRVYGSRSTGER